MAPSFQKTPNQEHQFIMGLKHTSATMSYTYPQRYYKRSLKFKHL